MAGQPLGDGSTYQRSRDGRWVAAVELDPDPRTGRRRRRTALAVDRDDAERKLRELLTLRDAGRADWDQRTTLRQWVVDGWLPRVEGRVRRGEVAPSTLVRNRGIMLQHVLPAIGRHRLASLRVSHVEDVYDACAAKGLSPASVVRVRGALSKCLSDARAAGIAVTNVAKDVPPPRVQRERRPTAGLDGVRRLVELSGEVTYGIAFALLAGTGLRVGELRGLAWSDVVTSADGRVVLQVRRQVPTAGRTFTRLKTPRSRRDVPLPGLLVEPLRAHRDAQAQARAGSRVWTDPECGPLVVASSVGTPVEYTSLRRIWTGDPATGRPGLRDRVGMSDLRLHDLRHTAATLRLAATGDAEAVGEVLGHVSSRMVTEVYGHVLDGRQAAMADALDRLLEG